MTPQSESQNSSCIACTHSDQTPLLTGYGFDDQKEDFELKKCGKCNLVHVAPVLSFDRLKSYYSSSYYGSKSQKFNPVLESLVRYANSLRVSALFKFLKKGTNEESLCCLDVGCGRGNFLKALSAKQVNCYGTEISTFDLPKDDSKIHFCQGSLEQIQFQSEMFDAVTIWHVLEHTLNPVTTIQEIARITKKGGIVAIAVPNFGSWQASLFGKHWFHLDLPRHLYHFTNESLDSILKNTHFDVLEVQTQSLDQNLYGFIQSFLNLSLPFLPPNHLYGLLKKNSTHAFLKLFLLLCYTPILAVLIPLSILENSISVFFNRGASLIIYAKKNKT